MRYLITTAEDSVFVSKLMKQNAEFDVVVFWENSEEAVEIESITSEDIVIFAVRNEQTGSLIAEVLRGQGLSDDNIINFYKIFDLHIPSMAADRAMVNPFYREYNGIILGLSHAEVGLLSDNFRLPTANLAVSSQDLYYNYRSLKYVTEKYPEKLKNVKFLILDMYKYNYFNFDTSLSKMAIMYYSWGGFDKDPHHFEQNRNFSNCFEEVKQYLFAQRKKGITGKALDTWSELFDFNIDAISKETFSAYYKSIERGGVVTDSGIENYEYAPGNVMVRHEDTVKENEKWFREIIRYAKESFPDIKIYVIQMPMYEEGWKRSEATYGLWKEDFERIIFDAQKELDFEYEDMTQHPISKDRKCWQDIEHLNYYGSLKFTEVINSKIFIKS